METDILKDTQKKLNIIDVNLRGGNIFVNDSEDDLNVIQSNGDTKTQSFRITSQIKEATFESSDEKSTYHEYRFTYTLGIRLIYKTDENVADKDEEYRPIAEIIAHFVARYRSIEQVNEEGLNEFAKENVGYHVWPFWREYVQTTCSRIGINPVFNVPFYFTS